MKHNSIFLRHILDEINFILKETINKNLEGLMQNETLKRACLRSLEIIGEAAKNISPKLKAKYKDVEWKRLAGLRDKIIHYYFGVDWDIVWDVIKNKLPALKYKIGNIIEDEKIN